MGPIKPNSYAGRNKFIISFVDDHSRYARSYCILHKNEAGMCLGKFLEHMRNLLGKTEKICYIRADNGTEFTGGKFAEIMAEEGISNGFAPPYTPELNRTAERFNKTIENKIRALMLDSGIPGTMWGLATEAAIHIYNRTPHKSIECKTPLCLVNPEKKSHTEEISRFGSLAYIRIPTSESKFSEKAVKAILVGYAPMGYLLWHPQTGKYLTSRHVKFNEKLVYKDYYKSNPADREIPEIEKESEPDVKFTANQEPENYITKVVKTSKPKRGRPPKRKNVQSKEEPKIKVRKLPERNAKNNPIRDPKFVYRLQSENCKRENGAETDERIAIAAIALVNRDPTNYREAMQSEDREAIEDELQSMSVNQVW